MKGVSDRADLLDKGVEYLKNAKQQLDHAARGRIKLHSRRPSPTGRHSFRGKPDKM
ncbi:hypothetical protein [Duncaniella muris]|uniref:hypothetical protein n=1 Tax=Duncaniella muris TaxID=2094150 RepID=UPI003F66D341